MAKKGRKPKPYITTWGEIIPDLARDADGRWRIIPTRERFTEENERLAIMRFRKWQQSIDTEGVRASVNISELTKEQAKTVQLGSVEGLSLRMEADGSKSLGMTIPPALLWTYVRDQLLKDPLYVAQQTGIPQLANLATMDLPRRSLRLAELRTLYRDKNTSGKETKAQAIAVFDQLVKHTGAVSLADLNTEKLLRFREHVLRSGKKAGTVAAYFGRLKWIVAFGKQWGLDTKQLDDALSRMAVLHPPKNTAPLDPQPIEPADYDKLLNAAEGDDRWTFVLLAAMNFVLHIDECFALLWEEIDLKKGTLVTRRSKTKVRRVAILWPETIAALEKIPRTQSPWVLTSTHGTRFNSKGQWKRWNAIRIAANCPDVKFDQIRDGGYTVAMEGATDERQARVLAGHRVPGLIDNYVARNAEFVRPAVDAIYQRYMATREKKPKE